ncbi:kinesin-like protein KIF3A [Haliotis asinina]|uniref:kinesin-like protein KIF3A n=1 Tax=Haliotis asinina TaxID=109174 RepID=UPI0035319B52
MSRTGNKTKSTRPLGSLRHNISAPDKVPHIPRLINKIDGTYEGIQGNAMSVPPPTSRESTQRESAGDADKGKNSARSSGSSSVKSQDLVDRKELKDALAREKELKLTIADLERIIEELRALLALRDQEIVDLQDKIRIQGEEHKAVLQKEKSKHADTQALLEETRSELEDEQNRVDAIRKDMSRKLSEQKTELEKKYAEMLSEKDKEISIRDVKLNRLKQQMADALKGNSWERQQQLEELTKELARIQDEADLLRMKLKAYAKNKTGSCSNCPDMMAKLDRAHLMVKDRDHTVKELKAMCSKMEKQLTQQDQLLKSWADSRGHKAVPPK